MLPRPFRSGGRQGLRGLLKALLNSCTIPHLSSCRAVSALLLLLSAALVSLWSLLCSTWHLLLHTLFDPDQTILRDGVRCLSILSVCVMVCFGLCHCWAAFMVL